jgi:hypothetical protein
MPSATSRSTPASAVVDPNRLTTPRTATAGGRLRRDPSVSGCDNKVALLGVTSAVGGDEQAHRHRHGQAEPPPHLGQLSAYWLLSLIEHRLHRGFPPG